MSICKSIPVYIAKTDVSIEYKIEIEYTNKDISIKHISIKHISI